MMNIEAIFQTMSVKPAADYLAPDGSEIRLLPTTKGGGLSLCTLPAGTTSSPVAHHQVEEIWYVASGEGEIWRKNAMAEETVHVGAGTALTILPGTITRAGLTSRWASFHSAFLLNRP